MVKRKILIIGARLDGHAGVLLDVINEIGAYEIVGFLDNTPDMRGKIIAGIPVLGSTNDIEAVAIQADCAHVAIGDNMARGNIFKILSHHGVVVEKIIHPNAHISSKAHVGMGSFVGAGAIINNGVQIGNACIINTAAVVEHDNVIGFAVHMAPATTTAGRVKIGDYVFVGVGATILPDVNIGEGALIGAGSVVVRDIESKQTVVGYAARQHKKNIYMDTNPDVDTHKVFAGPTPVADL